MNKKIYNILFYLTYLGFIMDDVQNIGVPWELQRRFYIIGIPSRDIALFAMLGIFYLHRNTIFFLIKKKYIYIIMVMLWIYTLQGLVIGGISSIAFIRSDLRIILWFIGGISFGYILIKTENVKANMRVIVALTTLLIIAATVSSNLYKDSMNLGLAGFERITESGMFRFSGIVFVPLILLFNIEKKKIKDQIIPIFCICTLVYCMVYLSNTRSISIMIFTIIILYYISLELNNYLNNRVSVLRIISIIVVMICTISYFFLQLSKSELRLERLYNISATAIGNDPRYYEGIQFIEQSLNSNSIIFGQGMGGNINSLINTEEATIALHIGILNFWMKMGIIPFIIISILLFFKIPILYLKSLNRRNKFILNNRKANIVVLPSLFPWIIGLAMSGGFNEASFLGCGIAYLFYGEICKNGLTRITGYNMTIKSYMKK